MDLEEWDLLSDEGFIDLHEKNSGANKFCPKSTTSVIDMNYFEKLSEPEKKKMKNSRVIPVPIQLDQSIGEIPEEVIKLPIDDDQTPKSDEADFVEPASKVFFKKLKENEFVDMKMDSPKSLNRGILAQIDVGSYQFEKVEEKKEGDKDEDDKKSNEEGLKVWKWAMTGIGALFSFGFAAATISFVVLGNRHKERCNSSNNQELHFQLYAHDKVILPA